MFATLAKRGMIFTTSSVHYAFHAAHKYTMRHWLSALLILLSLLTCVFSLYSRPAQATQIILTTAKIVSADYHTRITLESSQPIRYELSMLNNPERVVIDLENVELNQVIQTLPNKLGATNPLIQKIRYGRFKPHVIRLVFDLKVNVVPRTFLQEPSIRNNNYGLILDLYHPDKAATIPETPDTKTVTTAKKPSNTDPEVEDDLSQLIASLLKKKPGQFENHEKKPLPKSYYVARYHKPAPPRIVIVAIDPGHGGKDPGAVGKNGTREKDITLAISHRLKAIIDQAPFMKAIMTREGDYDLPLKRRQAIARKHNADLFISIHADGSPRPHAHGSSVYTLSEHGATSTTASWLAQKENSVDDQYIGGVDMTEKNGDMREIILDLSMSATINDSVKVAQFVLAEIGQINRLHKKTVEQAGFVVLKSPDIPSILVETAFITNPSEEKKLKSNGYQKKMAHAIFDGIKKYFDTNPALTRTDVARVR